MHETPVGLVPYLTIRNGRANEALDFYERAFGAEVLLRDRGETAPPGMDTGGKVIHARLRVNGALVFLSDDFPEWKGKETPEPAAVTLHLQTGDVEGWWKRAIDAGCSVVFPLADQFWGDRYGQLLDPFGHSWSIAQTIRK